MKAKEEVTQMRKEVLGNGNQQLPNDSQVLDIVIQNDVSKCSDDDKQWLKSIINPQSIEGVSQTRRPKIQRVPSILREIEAQKDCFDPLMVSIGPYHHGKPKLELMEKHKIRIAQLYANNDLRIMEDLYIKVMGVAKAARECYTDDGLVGRFDDQKFTRMMFVDGCFIIQFIYSYTHNERDNMKMKINVAACVQRDMFLLENQVPFLVLKELMSSRFKENQWKKMFSDFIAQVRGPRLKKELFLEKFASEGTGKAKAHQQDDQLVDFEDEPAHLLDIIRSQLIDKSAFTPQNVSDWSSYRSAKELEAVGIHFRPSKTRRFTDVTFNPMFFTDVLKLPPITIDDSTESMLLNMVAYEACPDGPDDFGVSSYICFMDSLIDRAEDVEELRRKGILLNFLGSDQQVADLFNQIADNLVPNPYAYAMVKHQIEKHYKNKIKIWLAEWLHTHFSTPWTFLAFVGAIFALFLSVVQTFFDSWAKGLHK